ncbi:MAG: hypothetical protein AAF560_26040 [Acidobacteriota bacterium]
MSSRLWIINWTAFDVDTSLNQLALETLKASTARDHYFPYATSAPRDPSRPGEPGIWGSANNLVVVPGSGSGSQIYNGLPDPRQAVPTADLLLWIFPSCLVFSQESKQLGECVKPSEQTP